MIIILTLTHTFTVNTQSDNPYIDGQKDILLQAIFQTLKQPNVDETDCALMRKLIQHNQTLTPFDTDIEAIAKKDDTYDLFMILDEMVSKKDQLIKVFEDNDQHIRRITIGLNFRGAVAEYASDAHTLIQDLLNQLYNDTSTPLN